jgi:hypothetical protein
MDTRTSQYFFAQSPLPEIDVGARPGGVSENSSIFNTDGTRREGTLVKTSTSAQSDEVRSWYGASRADWQKN